MYGEEEPIRFSPDGLTEGLINVLIAEVADELATLPAPTSALMSGEAHRQRNRRVAQRQLSRIVRVLRVHKPVLDTSGNEAA
ncbi:hypothetical protein JOF41_006386 [Saccharothrix coeruleofusca]|uniref:hypothetical protein n=1 Tax=Saccharothrix coeruleofusca TaxID=33919 RepID=UPI001AE20AB9|nr:hypothetical protein [Saccharothrix coeruleofusca]MBP2340208.1 hypothetical protein [Saccharothrix coeruleofusca]